jgi:hypothetical protein
MQKKGRPRLRERPSYPAQSAMLGWLAVWPDERFVPPICRRYYVTFRYTGSLWGHDMALTETDAVVAIGMILALLAIVWLVRRW